MRNIIRNILIVSIILSLNCGNAIAAAMPEPVPATQTDKQKAAAAKKKEAEKKKKEAEKKKKEAAKAKAAKEKQKAAAEKANDKKKADAEKQKAAAAKDQAKAAAERERAAEARAKAAAEREAAKAKKEAEIQAREEKQLRDYERYQASLENPRTEAISYISLGLRAGYSAMMDKINGSYMGAGTLNQSNALQQLKGGAGAGLDLT